jgi:predicted transcriptional regulator
MRISVTIDDAQLKLRGDLARRSNRPRAALIREAVQEYLVRQGRSAVLQEAFGLRGARRFDRLDYQERLCDDWQPR